MATGREKLSLGIFVEAKGYGRISEEAIDELTASTATQRPALYTLPGAVHAR
jgi:hypothetical protein